MRLPLVKSTTENWTSNGKAEWTDPLPVTGPRGGRRVIRGVIVSGTFSATIAAANLPALDKVRIIKNLVIKQRGGMMRWNLSGMESLLACQMLRGSDKVNVGAVAAIGAPGTISFKLYIPFRKTFGKRGKDFALPVDCLESITVEMPATGDLTIGGATVTLLSGSYYLAFDTFEDKLGEVIDYSQDMVAASNFVGVSESTLKVRGAIHDLFLCRPTITAGGAVTVTEFRSESLGIEPVAPADLAEAYRESRGVSVVNTTLDPVEAGRVVAPIFSHEELSAFHGRVVSSPMLRISGNTDADLRVVYRTVPGKDEGLTKFLEAEYKLAGAYQIKTAGKTRRELAQGWADREAMVLPAKAKR